MTTSKYTETCNIEIAKKLSNISIEDYLRLCDKDNSEENQMDCMSWLKIMRRYSKEIVKNGKVITNYKFAKNCEEGRLYAEGDSLQLIKREFRGILSDNIYYDFDMINCHPVILNHLCKVNKIEFKSESEDKLTKLKALNEYCINRESRIEKLCEDDKLTRSEAKLLFIKSINTEFKVDKVNGKKIKNKFFIQFDSDIKAIMPQLMEKCPDEYKIIKKSEKKNIKGKFMSYICRKYESIILNKVCENYEADVLMYDGFMIKCNKVEDIETTITELNEITKEYGVLWSNKEHDISLLEEVENLETSTEDVEIVGKELEDVAKELFDTIYDKHLAWCSNNLWFKSSFGWINNKKRIERFLFAELTKYKLFTVNSEGEYIRVHSVKSYNDLISFITTWANDNDKLLDEIQLFCFQKIFFKNGYYDIKENKLIESKNFNTIKRIEKDFVSKDSVSEEIKFVYEKILDPMFTCDTDDDTMRKQLRDNFLYNMSRVMFGHYQDKNWYSMDGFRDCGKGIISTLLEKSFEKYVCTTHSENFLYKPSQNSDEAKAKSFLLDFLGCRLVVCNEIKIDKNSYFDGNKIKSFCSGGDTQSARKNHQDEQYFKLECGLMFCCNDLPEIKPADAKERQIEYTLCSKFCNEEEYQEKIKKKEISYRYYRKDETLKMKLSEEKIQMAFIHILIDAFRMKNVTYPEALTKINETDDNDDFKTFDSFFNFEQSEKSFILLKDIVVKCKENNILFQQKKIKQLLINKGKVFNKTRNGQACYGISFVDDN